MQPTTIRPILFALAVLALTACGQNDVIDVAKVEIQLSDNSISFSSSKLGEEGRRQFFVENVSAEGGVLEVVDITIDQARDDFAITCTRDAPFALQSGKRTLCEVTFTPSALAAQTATVTFESNAANPASGVMTLSTLALRQDIEATPAQVTFTTREGQGAQQIVRIRNVGTAPLRIAGYEVTGQADLFSATHDEARYGALSEAAPLILEPHDAQIGPTDPGYENNELQIFVDYAPETLGADRADLKIFSDDPSEEILTVPLVANTNAPCILTEGVRLDFGNTQIGRVSQKTVTIQNCGTADLLIDRLEPGDNTATLEDTDAPAVFIIDAGAAPDGTLAEPMTIPPGEVGTFVLIYAPTEERPDQGELNIHSNDPLVPVLELKLFGRGVDGVCPTASARGNIQEQPGPFATELNARPLQTLLLDGTGSEDIDGTITDYIWDIIEQPDGSSARPQPVGSEPNNPARRELFLDLAGRFIIELTVIDNDGCASEPARVTVLVSPGEAVHIQLVWNNPTDPDQTDLSGSDLDTHFVKMGPGAWFQSPYDNYFDNREPFWSPENPSLDIDDTNGAGPENINMDDPTPCQWYALGIHYWRQQFGTAYATARIFVNGQLVFEYTNKPMQSTGDFWDVARIHWPSGEIVTVDDMTTRAAIDGRPPATTDGMRDTGLCGTP